MRTATVALLTVTLVASSQAPAGIQVPAAADGNVKSHFVNINYGPHQTWQVGLQVDGRAPDANAGEACCTPPGSIGQGDHAATYRGLVYFDLSGVTTPVVGDATVELFVREIWTTPDDLEVRVGTPESVTWRDIEGNGIQLPVGTGGAAGFTWNNFGAGEDDCDTPDTDACAGETRMNAILARDPIAVLDLDAYGARTTPSSKAFPFETLSIPIPGDLVQAWIDDPATNGGLMLTMQNESGNDADLNNRIEFVSREADLSFLGQFGAHHPRLTFEIPEPATLLLLVGGALGTSRRRR